MRYLHNYLFEDTFDILDYDAAIEFFKRFKMPPSACSAARKGNIIGRNLDWYVDENVDFVVHTPNTGKRYATLGVAHTGHGVTSKALMDGNVPTALYNLMPFLMSDCINERGLYCSINVVPVGDKQNTSPIGMHGIELCQLMIPRYVCDNAATVAEAISLLENCIIFAPLSGLNQECHFMLSDRESQAIIEFADGEIQVIADENILTNFHLYEWNYIIASAALGSDEIDIERSGLTDHAMGLERYMILNENLGSVQTMDDMANLMKSVQYTKAYDRSVSPYWYSEFYGPTETFGDLTIYSTSEEMEPVVQYAIDHFNPRSRDGQSWNTTHTSIYNLDDLTLNVYVQEEYNQRFDFSLKSSKYGILGIDLLKPNSRLP